MKGEGNSSLQLFSDVIYKWLDVALDSGIAEKDFWEMTFSEINRAIGSFNRVQRARLQEKASFDYLLADLIGKSLVRLHNSSYEYPDIGSVYPTLFDTEAIQQQKQEKQDKLSALRFKQFAQSHNKKF